MIPIYLTATLNLLYFRCWRTTKVIFYFINWKFSFSLPKLEANQPNTVKMLYNLFFILLLSVVIKANSSALQSVSDDELLELIRDKEKLVVLFSKSIFKSRTYKTDDIRTAKTARSRKKHVFLKGFMCQKLHCLGWNYWNSHEIEIPKTRVITRRTTTKTNNIFLTVMP